MNAIFARDKGRFLWDRGGYEEEKREVISQEFSSFSPVGRELSFRTLAVSASGIGLRLRHSRMA